MGISKNVSPSDIDEIKQVMISYVWCGGKNCAEQVFSSNDRN